MRSPMSLTALLLLGACSTPTSPDGGGGTPKVTNYSGLVAATGQSARSGRLDLASTDGTTTATGTITLESAARIGLTGTYTSGTKTFSLQGGGYQFTATVLADSQVTGTGTLTLPAATATPTAPFAASPPALVMTQIGVKAFVTATASPAVGFRGTYNGLYYAGLSSEIERGDFYFVIQGTPYVTNQYRVSGWAPTSGEVTPGSPSQIQLEGVATLSNGDIPSNIRIGASIRIVMVGSSDGVVNGQSIDSGSGVIGTYYVTSSPGYSQGTWRVSRYF